MATIKEVAHEAGVSVATVSRVVNKNGYVSEERRVRVVEAMRHLDYKPSAVARSLRRQESLTIGVLVPGIHQPFFAALAFVIQKTLFASDYRVLMCSSEEDASKEAAYVDMLLHQRVDGVIVAPTGHGSETIHPLLSRMPVILVDRDLPDLALTRVLADNFRGGYDAMTHLIALGHTRIAVIGGPPYSRAMEQRTDGARRACADAGVVLDSSMVLMSELSEFKMGFELALDLLRRHPRPTAIFALTDVVAVGVMHASAELKLSLPHDLSVIGFDDIPLASYIIPALTTIAQPIERMAETAARLLLERLKNGVNESFETVTLDMKLMQRASTAAPRGS
ncbi:MAG: LacI family DNA-binding transcriptional regulator [Chloroflexota bacterium]|nr:LacI family DNA-binding transcriptional regulator [Chloroflexota bacterium]